MLGIQKPSLDDRLQPTPSSDRANINGRISRRCYRVSKRGLTLIQNAIHQNWLAPHLLDDFSRCGINI